MRNKLGGYSLFAAGALAALLALGPAVPAGLAFAEDAPVAASEDASAAKGASAAGAAATVAGAPADPAADVPADAADAPVDPAADGKVAGKAKAAQAGGQTKASETYTVSFWGGATQEVKAGEKATPAPEPEYGTVPEWAGPNGKMVFVGWVEGDASTLRTIQGAPTEQDFASRFVFSQPITRDVELSALFACPSHVVSFQLLCQDAEGHTVVEHYGSPDGSVPGNAVVYNGNSLNDMVSDELSALEAWAKDVAQEHGGKYMGLFEGDYDEDIQALVPADKVDVDKPVGEPVSIVAYITKPGCEHDTSETFGAVVNDKGAEMDIPVVATRSDGVIISGADISDSLSASGTLSGSNVKKGSKVYINRVINGMSGLNEISFDFQLMVDGKPVTSDFGSIKLSVRLGDYKEMYGEVHDIEVKTSDGKTAIVPVTMSDNAWVTFDFVPGKTNVAVGSVSQEKPQDNNGSQDNGSQGDAQSPSKPQAITVTGAEGVKASGNLAGKNVPAGSDVKVNAAQLKAGDAAYDKLAASMGKGELAGVYDISLLVNGTEVHNDFGELAVVLPVDPAHNGHWVTVWHLHNDGSVTSERTVAVDGAVAFTVTDLSSFALEVGEMAPTGTAPDGQADQPSDAPEAEDGKPANRDDAPTDQPKAEGPKGGALPQTGDPAALLGLVAASGAAFMAFGAASKRRR